MASVEPGKGPAIIKQSGARLAEGTATIRPDQGKVAIENSDGRLRLAFPVRASPFGILFFGIFFLVFLFGEASALYTLVTGDVPDGVRFSMNGVESRSSNDPHFMAKWLSVWTVATLVPAGGFLCAVARREIIELDATRLRRRRLILGLGRSEEYAVADIAELRLSPAWTPYSKHFHFVFNVGAISFDHRHKTFYLGTGLDAGESKYVIAEMCKRVKALRAGRDDVDEEVGA